LSSKEIVIYKLKNIFPADILNKLRDSKKQFHGLSIVRCIDANSKMRKLLLDDFALGVIDPSKSGKSILVRNMFGSNTNCDNEIRPADLYNHRMNDQFRVVDFAHMTSVFDYVRNCFTCSALTEFREI
jgi:hypothetical protein